MGKRSLTHQTASGIAWQSLGIGANLLLRVAILVLLTRSLRAEDFGIVAAAMVAVSIAKVFSEIGVPRALVQRIELDDEHIRSAFAISLYTGVGSTAAVVLAAPLIAALFRMDGLEPFVRFLSLTLLLNAAGTVSAALLQRERRFKGSSLIEIGSFVLGFGFVALPLARAGFGAWSLALAYLVQALARAIGLIAMRRPLLGLLPTGAAARSLLHVGSGYTAGQFGNLVATQIDYLIVGRWLGAEALGFYNRAYQFLMLPAQLFGTAVATVLFPSLAAIQDQPQRVSRAYQRAMGVIAMLTLPVSGVLMILAPELVRYALGPQWTGMVLPFQILIASLLFRTSYKISDAVTMAMGSMYRRAWRQWIYAAAVAGGALAGTAWGLAGVAIGVGAAVVLNFLLMLQLARRVTSLALGPIVAVHVRQLVASAAIVAPVWIAVALARRADLGELAVLGVGSLVAAGTTAVLWFGFRRLFGEEGAWLHELIVSRLGLVQLRKTTGTDG